MDAESITKAICDAHLARYPDGLVPPDEAAPIVRLSPKTMASMRSRGEGPRWIKSGSRVYYPLKELADWFGQRSVFK